MKFFYDSEFFEHDNSIEPVSLGMVSHDHAEVFYWVNTSFDWDTLPLHPNKMWLKANVAPRLYDIPTSRLTSTAMCSPDKAGQQIQQFIQRCGGDPKMYGYYSSYDHVVLSQIFDGMMNWPFKGTFFTTDVKILMNIAGVKRARVPKPEVPHNAAHDAVWVKDCYHEHQLASVETLLVSDPLHP